MWETHEISFIPIQIFCVITNLVFVFPLVLMWERRFYFHLPFVFTLGTTIHSITFHTCQMTNGTLCLFSLEVHRSLDHISAEFNIILVVIFFMYIKSVHWFNLLILVSMLIFVNLRLVSDTLWILAAFLFLLGPVALYKSWYDRYLPRLFFLGAILSAVGLALYFMDRWYDITHPLWHITIALAYFVDFLMYLTSERNRKMSALQRRFPDSYIQPEGAPLVEAEHNEEGEDYSQKPQKKVTVVYFSLRDMFYCKAFTRAVLTQV